jgi:hypothetical protein
MQHLRQLRHSGTHLGALNPVPLDSLFSLVQPEVRVKPDIISELRGGQVCVPNGSGEVRALVKSNALYRE